jgi:putative nucleotidyltransferase with HDIG domain
MGGLVIVNKVNMLDLIYCITNTSDLISNEIANHHKRVAYLSYRIAKAYGLTREEQRRLFVAGFLHDIGAFSKRDRLSLIEDEPQGSNSHAFIGANILEDFEPLREVARIIRFHHIPWQYGEGNTFNSMDVPLFSHIVHLADRIVVLIDTDEYIIGQIEDICKSIKARSGEVFVPELVDVFLSISHKEHIWLDLTYDPMMKIMPSLLNFDPIEIDIDEVVGLSEVFANIVDFRSPFTVNHSAGVAAVAAKLAAFCGFSENECKMMLVAGYLHDLGKLAIDNDILEKPGSLDKHEFDVIRSHTFYTYRTLQVVEGFETINIWASYHHEKLNGKGYPFHLSAEEIPLGSRIMAFADIFTAITEDRPYRKGMDKERVLMEMKRQVENGALCAYVYKMVVRYYEELDTVRKIAQKRTSIKYKNINKVECSDFKKHGNCHCK